MAKNEIEPKKFLMVKNINKKPSYWGLSQSSVIIILVLLLLAVLTAKGFKTLIFWTLIVSLSVGVLLTLDTKYKGLFFSKYLRFHTNKFKGTKVKMSYLLDTMSKYRQNTEDDEETKL
ncbi:hypothetical protein CMT75_18840 [Elizabethkingia anophelis]|nr:hypothetical protein [Elizabethkingia anophelis]